MEGSELTPRPRARRCECNASNRIFFQLFKNGRRSGRHAGELSQFPLGQFTLADVMESRQDALEKLLGAGGLGVVAGVDQAEDERDLVALNAFAIGFEE